MYSDVFTDRVGYIKGYVYKTHFKEKACFKKARYFIIEEVDARTRQLHSYRIFRRDEHLFKISIKIL